MKRRVFSNDVPLTPLYSIVRIVVALSAIGAIETFKTISPVYSQETPSNAVAAFAGTSKTTSTRGLDSLPAADGQFWTVYDITPYTNLYPNLPSPQQTIVNWILADLDEQFWHSEPFGVLSATREKLLVYHNQQVQTYMSNVIDRFVDPAHKNEMFKVRLIAVQTPDWRTRAAAYLRPFAVRSKEMQGWLLNPEQVDLVVGELARRSDFVELNAAKNSVPNGETFGWILPAPVRTYIRDVQLDSKAAVGYVAENGSIDEGYRIEITPLISTDGRQLEFLFKFRSTVVEKMHSFHLKAPTTTAPKQQLAAELPQIARSDLSDKISFPKSNVFLLDLGMVPLIITDQPNSSGIVGSISKLVSNKPIYYNVLVFIQSE